MMSGTIIDMRRHFKESQSNRSLVYPFMFLLEAALGLILAINPATASAGPDLLAANSWSNDDFKGSRSSYSRDLSGSDVSPFSPGSHNLALDIGQVFLIGDLSKYQNTLGTQIHYNYGVSDLFSFDSSFGFSSHSDGQFSLMNLTGGIRMNLSWYDKIIPYGILGLGFYLPSYTDLTAAKTTATSQGSLDSSKIDYSSYPSISALLFGLHFGPGVDLAVSKNVFFGASLIFHQMFGTTKTQANNTLLNLGGAYSTFFLHIGGTF